MLQGSLISSTYCKNLVRRDLNLMQILSIVIDYNDGMLISEMEEQVRIVLNIVVIHMTNRGC